MSAAARNVKVTRYRGGFYERRGIEPRGQRPELVGPDGTDEEERQLDERCVETLAELGDLGGLLAGPPPRAPLQRSGRPQPRASRRP